MTATIQKSFTPEAQALAKDILAYWDYEAKFKSLVNFDIDNGVHNQGSWVGNPEVEIESVDVEGRRWDVCDSTMCAAGTAVFLTSTPKEFKQFARENYSNESFWSDAGRELLGLSLEDAYFLFYDTDEPLARTLMGHIASNDWKSFRSVIDNY